MLKWVWFDEYLVVQVDCRLPDLKLCPPNTEPHIPPPAIKTGCQFLAMWCALSSVSFLSTGSITRFHKREGPPTMWGDVARTLCPALTGMTHLQKTLVLEKQTWGLVHMRRFTSFKYHSSVLDQVPQDPSCKRCRAGCSA